MSELRRIFSLSLVPLGLMVCVLLAACGDDEDTPMTQPDAEAAAEQRSPNGAPLATQQVVVESGDPNPDVNRDGIVTIVDLVTVSAAFGEVGEGLAADINGDGVVNILDLVTVSTAFGESVEFAIPRPYEGMAAAWTGNPNIPVIVAHEGGEQLAVLSDDGQTVTGGVYTTKDGDSLVVWAGPDGLPRRAQGNGATLLFENYTDSTVDVAILGPDGSTEILRGIAVDMPATVGQAPGLVKLSPVAGDVTLSGQIRGVSIFLSIAGCAASAALAVASSGLTLPVFLHACGAAIISVGLALVAETNPELAESAGAIGTVVSVAGCVAGGDAGSCVSVIADIAARDIEAAEDEVESIRQEVEALEVSLVRVDDGTGPSFESEGIVFLPVSPGGSITLRNGATFDVEPFYIAKHETTNAQYEAFVQSGDGFDNPAWWTDMPAAWTPPRRGLDARRNPLPDAPRDNVSWYQAVAFTRWLNARMASKNADISTGGLLVNGVEWEVRLPAEWEWQWAAQGGAEEREYPWGDWQEGHANTREAGVGATTAVGSYPLGAAASGALDMSGNVWEWCLNKWESPHSTTVDDTNEFRVLRGGSFISDRRNATSSIRNNSRPHNDWNVVGFRVGAFPPL